MFSKVISVILNAQKVGIVAHTHPDGDAMGSSYSLKIALEQKGIKSEVFLSSDSDATVEPLIIKGENTGIKIEECDLLIALDCADIDRLGMYAEVFSNHENTIAIDHHVTHKEYAKKGTVVANISSTCELIVALYDQLDIKITHDIANNLYIGLITDTGNFKFSSVTGDTLRTAAYLVDTGINSSGISEIIFDTKTKEYYDLMGIAIGKLEYFLDNKVAVLFLSNDDYEEAGIDESNAIGIVSIPISIEGVEVGIYIRNRENGTWKISLRSSRYVNVADIASAFGGGGHVRASGFCAHDTTFEKIKSSLIKELEDVI